MRVLYLVPPNFGEINRAFRIRGKPVIFCYGDTIYNPTKMKIPPELFIHEAVHSDQQAGDPRGWWQRYIADREFRLDQEIAAHRAEYADLCARGRADMLRHVAERLCSPLYGGLIDLFRARECIAAGNC